MKVGTLEIELMANVARLAKDMSDVKRSVTGTMAGVEKSVAMAKAAIGGLFAGFTVATAVNKLVTVQREFDVLNAGLITATGSMDNAAIAFGALQDFASTTPFGLAEVTDAFIKMRNLGLDPSEAALRSYGNTASAMGKSLNQFIEAVADASTGEFERLKEFGIKARQEGDKVSLTFQGVTTKIGNNAADIQRYLKALGDVQFAGAMEQRAKTLDGAISNLGDTWDGLFRAVSQQGVGDLIYEATVMATEGLQELTDMLASGELQGYIDAIAVSFRPWADDIVETIDIVNAFMSQSFEGWGEDGEGAVQWITDAFRHFPQNVRAFIQLVVVELAALADKAKIVGAAIIDNLNPLNGSTQFSEMQGEFDAIDQARRSSIMAIIQDHETAIDAANKEVEAAKRARQEYDAKREAAKSATQDRLSQFGIKPVGSPVAGPSDAELKAAKKAADEYEKLMDRIYGDAGKIHDQVTAQQEYNDRLGLTREQIAALEAAKLEDAAASKEQSAALADLVDISGQMGDAYRMQADELRILAELKREGAKKQEFVEAQKAEADAAKKVWEDFSTNVQRNLGDTLYSGMRGDFDNIGDAWLAMIQRMAADAMAADLASALLGGGKGGGTSSFIGGLGSLISGFFGGGGVGANGMLTGSSAYEMSANNAMAMWNAKGNAFWRSQTISEFAKGDAFTNGIVSKPTLFDIGGMGEAGPEAIMPLSRGPDGSLGVRASGGGGVSLQVVINNNAPVKAEARPLPDGSGIEVMITEIENRIGENITYGNGAVNAALKNRYDLKETV